MNTVNVINELDGNKYLVNSASGVSNTASVNFDDMFNEKIDETLEDIFQDVSKEYDVPIRLLKAVAQAESGFDTNAVSRCGASGIMQLMPETAKSLEVEDVFDARQNITGGAKMLAYLLNDYEGNTTLALAAYNAGSGAVAKYGGVPPYAETQNYIKKINEILNGELEADTTNISIAKNNNALVTSDIDNSNSANTVDTVNTGNSSDNISKSSLAKNLFGRTSLLNGSAQNDLFSYEMYLKFLEIYNRLADISSAKLSGQHGKTSEVEYTSLQQNLYEIQKARFNQRASSLLDAE